MNRMNLSDRERNIAIMVVFLAVVWGIYQGVYVPFQKRTESLQNRIQVVQKKIRKNLKTIQESQALEEKYQDILASFRQGGSEGQVMSSILSEIEGVATEINMRIADMKPKRVRQVDFYNNFGVSLAVDASLPEIMHFLYLVQTSPHMFQIEELSLNSNSSRPDAQLRCQLVLSRALIP